MSDILSFQHRTLARGRHMLDLGRPQDARVILEQLLSMPAADGPFRLEILRTLSQIEFHANRHRLARAYLRQAIALAPGDANLLELFALNIEADGSTRLKRGLKAAGRALRIDPREPRFAALLGRIAMAMGKRRLARRAFRRVAKLNPTAVDVLGTAMTGFLQLGLPQEAMKLLMMARVEMENCVELRTLWDRLRFELGRGRHRDIADAPAVLSFPVNRVSTGTRPPGDGILRADRGSAVGAPHILRRVNQGR